MDPKEVVLDWEVYQALITKNKELAEQVNSLSAVNNALIKESDNVVMGRLSKTGEGTFYVISKDAFKEVVEKLKGDLTIIKQ